MRHPILIAFAIVVAIGLCFGFAREADAASGWSTWPGHCTANKCATAVEACQEIAAGHGTTLKDMYPTSDHRYNCVYA